VAAALVIVFREILEAGMIIGIVLAVTRGMPGSRLWVTGGIAAGVLGSSIVAIFTSSIANAFEGYGQELFNATILAIAVVMLTWHNVWMARHGREMVQEMQQTGRAVKEGKRPLMALAVVVGAAVLREGAEVVLFLYGIAISSGGSTLPLAIGSFLGLVLGAGISGFTYLGLVHIPSRYLFRVTGWMVTLLAAGMAAQSVSFLEKAGAVDVLGSTLWNTAWLLPEDSVVGRLLHTLVGYADQPSVLQGLTYLATIAIIIALSVSVGRKSGTERAAAE
jgi:high-affinity iron transporter